MSHRLRWVPIWLAMALTGSATVAISLATERGAVAPPAGEPTTAGDWRRLAAWVLPAGALSLILLLLAHANRRQARLVSALRAAESAAHLAAAKEAAHAEHERFGRDLTLALQGQDTLKGFGTTLLEHLCRRLAAKAAAIHCYDAATDLYALAAHYAGGTSPTIIERFRPGEGVVGQVALDRRRRICEGTAADWLWVESGTQVSAPLTLIVDPVVSGDQVHAVIELALMRVADADSLALLEEVLPTVALSLDLLLAKLQTLDRFAHYRAMEEVQRKILSNISEGIFGQDLEGRVTFVNTAALRMLGFSEEEVLGQPMHALTHHHYADGRAFPREECPVYQSMYDGRTRTVVDQVFWHKDGTPVTVEYTAAPVMHDGKPSGAVINFRDISERLAAIQELERRDRQLQDSEARLRTLFDTANEGIWLIDTCQATTDLNPAMATILGLPREAVLGRTIFEFVDATNEAIFHEQTRRRREGATGAYEIALTRPDGSLIPCLLNASPLYDARGGWIGSFAMVTDLTRFRHREG